MHHVPLFCVDFRVVHLMFLYQHYVLTLEYITAVHFALAMGVRTLYVDVAVAWQVNSLLFQQKNYTYIQQCSDDYILNYFKNHSVYYLKTSAIYLYFNIHI